MWAKLPRLRNVEAHVSITCTRHHGICIVVFRQQVLDGNYDATHRANDGGGPCGFSRFRFPQHTHQEALQRLLLDCSDELPSS